jgi:hypothetical protein
MAIDTKPRTPGIKRPSQPVRQRQAKPVTAPRHTRPVPAQRPPRPPQRAERQQRMPFILLLVGLLGGALVTLLVISTTLDQGSYRISNLTQENATLANETHVLTQEVANAQNPGTLAKEAYQLGMRWDRGLRFINTTTGTISSSAPVAP